MTQEPEQKIIKEQEESENLETLIYDMIKVFEKSSPSKIHKILDNREQPNGTLNMNPTIVLKFVDRALSLQHILNSESLVNRLLDYRLVFMNQNKSTDVEKMV